MIVFSRKFAMGNAETFSLLPVARLLDKYLVGALVIVDPFARNSKRGTVTNDLSPLTEAQYHLLAENFVEQISCSADAVLFDPPYSPRQITECYQSIGRAATAQDTQNGRLYKRVKNGLDKLLIPGGIAICCGWNSMGFGLKRGYEMLEIMLVAHGAAHNDTIITVERKSHPRNGRSEMDVLHPELRLLVKLGSIAVHVDEFLSSDSHSYDLVALQQLLADPEVVEWLSTMDKMAMIPKKRAK